MPVPIPVPAGTGISYGNYNFDASAHTTNFSFKQILGDDHRTIVHVEIAITIQMYVTSSVVLDDDVTINSQMNSIRKTLQSNALPFVYNNGVGTFSINTNETKDVDFGPKVQMLRWQPIGSPRAAKVTWSVLVKIPECANAVFTNDIKELTYKVSWQITHGLTQRTCSGKLVIANNFILPVAGNNRKTNDCADFYRGTIAQLIPVPYGMHRLAPQQYGLSASRSQEDFTVTDQSLSSQVNIPPPNVLIAKFSNTIRSSTPYGATWNGVMDGEYIMPRNVKPSICFNLFWRAVLYRLRQTAQNLTIPAAAPGQNAATPSVILTGFRISEPNAYGPPTGSFGISYFFTTTLSSILGASGMWQALPDSNYTKWSTSMSRYIFGTSTGSRGFDNDEWTRGEVTINLCQPTKPVSSSSVQGLQTIQVSGNDAENNPFSENVLNSPFNQPKEKSSWVYFSNFVRLQVTDSTVELKAMPSQEIDPLRLARAASSPGLGPSITIRGTGGTGGTGGASQLPGPTNGLGSLLGVVGQSGATVANNLTSDPVLSSYNSLPGIPTPTAEVRSGPSVYVWLFGRAIRAGYPIDPPVLATVGGLTPIQARNEQCYFDQGIVGNWGGVPIIAARWVTRYLLPGIPTGIGLPSNPIGGT